MKKYFDKRLMGVFLMIFVFFTAACEAEAAKSLRQKSSVLLVFNNIAGTRYDEKLTQIALEKLQKKIEGIYLEIDAEPYGENFKEKSFEKASFAELTAQVDGCGADYFVYTELQPITKETHFNFIYFDKNVEVLKRILENVHKSFGKNEVLKGINLHIEQGQVVVIIGPSGSGKSTLLNAMAGFELVTSGSITIDGEEVKAPQLRYVTVFQNYGLLPWRTVESNIELGLESKKVPKEERPAIIDKYVKMVGLDHARNRYPAELSGGMQQRVSIARALAVDPDIIFMDEPLGALDALTRINLQDEISRICREEGKTVVFVTHDIEEAVVLADRVVVLAANPGRVQTIIPVNIIDRTDRTSASFVNIRNHIFEQFQLAKEDKIEFYI